jgi:hypothetical protein
MQSRNACDTVGHDLDSWVDALARNLVQKRDRRLCVRAAVEVLAFNLRAAGTRMLASSKKRRGAQESVMHLAPDAQSDAGRIWSGTSIGSIGVSWYDKL